eukprot:c43384_g1_i1 orf=187-369(+)
MLCLRTGNISMQKLCLEFLQTKETMLWPHISNRSVKRIVSRIPPNLGGVALCNKASQRMG